MTDYRIEYTVQRREDIADDFEDIGFGSSGTCTTVDQAGYLVETDIQRREWETGPGMPDPDSVGAD